VKSQRPGRRRWVAIRAGLRSVHGFDHPGLSGDTAVQEGGPHRSTNAVKDVAAVDERGVGHETISEQPGERELGSRGHQVG
jgi:hypothetical protein